MPVGAATCRLVKISPSGLAINPEADANGMPLLSIHLTNTTLLRTTGNSKLAAHARPRQVMKSAKAITTTRHGLPFFIQDSPVARTSTGNVTRVGRQSL